MFPVIVCEQFGWTYEEYLNAPQWMLDLIAEKMNVDAQIAKRAAEKAK